MGGLVTPMDRITVRVPEGQLERLDGLVERGEYSSRSEVVRDALRRSLSGGRGEVSDGERMVRL